MPLFDPTPFGLMWVDLTGMFLLGLLGGGHCVGMCGPIALAICPSQTKGLSLSAVLYNLGRVVTYTAIGGVVGAIGGSAADLGSVLRVQLWLTLLAGVLMAWFGLALLRVIGQPQWMFAIDGGKFPGVGKLMRGVVRGRGWMALPLGLLLGFLPCGLSMAAFTRALGAEGFSAGAVLVAAFGAGTLPAMLLVSWAGGRLTRRMRQAGEMVAGMILLAMAVQHVSKVVAALLG
ncbi:MAG: sulfite exporter TauE/SafE family protein [Myxococcota bacterium]